MRQVNLVRADCGSDVIIGERNRSRLAVVVTTYIVPEKKYEGVGSLLGASWYLCVK